MLRRLPALVALALLGFLVADPQPGYAQTAIRLKGDSPRPPRDKAIRTLASWYGEEHHGKPTASGEPFDMHALTAAHPSLPFGTLVVVTNLRNGRSVTVRVNDRGPFVRGRGIDLSYAAARALGSVGAGVVPVRIARPSSVASARR
jgi:rare lipoprotein A